MSATPDDQNATVELVYEYRVVGDPGRDRGRLSMRHSGLGMAFRSDDPMWQGYAGEDERGEGGPDLSGLHGVLGLVEATARSLEEAGVEDVRVERRRVESWEPLPRESLTATPESDEAS